MSTKKELEQFVEELRDRIDFLEEQSRSGNDKIRWLSLRLTECQSEKEKWSAASVAYKDEKEALSKEVSKLRKKNVRLVNLLSKAYEKVGRLYVLFEDRNLSEVIESEYAYFLEGYPRDDRE